MAGHINRRGRRPLQEPHGSLSGHDPESVQRDSMPGQCAGRRISVGADCEAALSEDIVS